MKTHDPTRQEDPDFTSEEQDLIDDLKKTDVYHHIFAQSPAAIGLAVADTWKFVDVNNGFDRVFGYRPEESVGHTLDELNIVVDDELGNILRRLEKEPIVEWETTKVRTKEGEIRDVLGSYMRIEIQGNIYIVIKLIDITEMRRLEREVLNVSDRERRKIGQDLHDDLAQWLDGIAMLARSFQEDLEENEASEAAGRAGEIADHLIEASDRARRLARGLAPATMAEEGLITALEDFAVHVKKTYGISCSVDYDLAAELGDAAAEQIYRIIQEAVHNAAQHSHASEILVRIRDDESSVVAQVIDDGIGISDDAVKESDGLGLKTMDYRARVIGGWLDVSKRDDGGTAVTLRVQTHAI